MAEKITRLLRQWKDGDDNAVEDLFPLVYNEMKRQARGYLRGERSDHTLQPTALVHEVYLRMVDQDEHSWNDRAHFFAISAITMRRVLVDHARRYASEKRGGGLHRVTLDNIDLADEQKAAQLLDLDDALNRLAEIDERKARVVEMTYFAGLSHREIADVLKVTEKTIQRDWKFAKLWLYRDLKEKGWDTRGADEEEFE